MQFYHNIYILHIVAHTYMLYNVLKCYLLSRERILVEASVPNAAWATAKALRTVGLQLTTRDRNDDVSILMLCL